MIPIIFTTTGRSDDSVSAHVPVMKHHVMIMRRPMEISLQHFPRPFLQDHLWNLACMVVGV